MGFLKIIERTFKNVLPSPFTIAVVLTLITFLMAAFFTSSTCYGLGRVVELMGFWEKGLWNEGLLVFAMQMMLMLVLGHVLALTKVVDRFISYVTRYCNNTANAAGIVTLLTILVSLFNWGLGLIFGAILARKVGEHAARRGISLNYALIGAAGYSGLMVWHGGLSGAAPLKVAEQGHLQTLMSGILPADQLAELPSVILPSETIFSPMNLTACGLLILTLPLFMYWVGKRSKVVSSLPVLRREEEEVDEEQGAEKLDRSMIFSLLIGGSLICYSVYAAVQGYGQKGLGFISPNYINLLLLALGLALHQSIHAFLKAVDSAIGGAAGILIQFPLYFGIMGLMRESGLVQNFSDFFVSISNETTFPVFTFISASIINIFVPSGGGQWAVQGPVVIQAATELGLSAPKSIMALAYGDQLTNMLQPFWALPLLGITGLKAKAILPYTVAFMGLGALIFTAVLLLF